MKKYFDQWNYLKKKIDQKRVRYDLYFHVREVWWCSMGINIGIEANGKNNHFERPVLIIKKFNSQMLWIVPLTSKEKTGDFFEKITHEGGVSYACITQIRVISTQRLLRKIGMVSEGGFIRVLEKFQILLKQSDPAQGAGSSEAEATNNQIIADNSDIANPLSTENS